MARQASPCIKPIPCCITDLVSHTVPLGRALSPAFSAHARRGRLADRSRFAQPDSTHFLRAWSGG
eukprot:scaffold40995_cov39-Tisochrysis_lutea.AAC.7